MPKLHIPKRALPERAVPPVRENAARALTPAEAQARQTLVAIAQAEAAAQAELAARQPQ